MVSYKHSENVQSDCVRQSDDLTVDAVVSGAESSVQNTQDASNFTADLQTHDSYYINEDIATNLDDSSPGEQSGSSSDSSSQQLNYLQVLQFFDKHLDDDGD